MPITANENGVLHTLGTVTTNDGGILRSNGTVSVNDGGVIRTVSSAKKASVEGITPAAEGKNYIVIDRSGAFTLSASAGTRIIIGSGGDGGSSGYSYDENNDEVCIFNVYRGQPSTLKINSTTYNSGSSRDIILTKAGKVGGGGQGGQGGQGAKSTSSGWLGWGGNGGQGGLPNGHGGDGGDGKRGGHGGSNGSGTDKGKATSSTTGARGGVGDTPGIYCYGGRGGDGNGGYKADSAQYRGCKGGQGGDGGYVAEYTLTADLLNAYCVLTVGTGSVGMSANENDYISPNPGSDGGNGVLIIEW